MQHRSVWPGLLLFNRATGKYCKKRKKTLLMMLQCFRTVHFRLAIKELTFLQSYFCKTIELATGNVLINTLIRLHKKANFFDMIICIDVTWVLEFCSGHTMSNGISRQLWLGLAK